MQLCCPPATGSSTATRAMGEGSSECGTAGRSPHHHTALRGGKLLQQADGTVKQGDGVKTKPKPPTDILFENGPAVSPQMQKKLKHLTGKSSPSLPEGRPSGQVRADCKHTVSSLTPVVFQPHVCHYQPLSGASYRAEICACPAAEVVLLLSALSGYWQAPSPSPSVNYFLPACLLAATSAGCRDWATVHFKKA